MGARLASAVMAFILLSLPGCARRAPEPVQAGPHNVSVLTPAGWEHLDHAHWQLFRHGEAQITLADFGPSVLDSLAPRADSAALVRQRVLESFEDHSRREVGRQSHRTIGGADWLVIETRDRLTHLAVRKCAVADDAGELLLLRIDHGDDAFTARAFDDILESLSLVPTVQASRAAR